MKFWKCAPALFLSLAWPQDIHVLPVQGNVYMLVTPGGNVALQAGRDGALLVDTLPPSLAQAAMAEIAKLTGKPLRHIISTSGDPDRVNGNAAFSALGQPGLNNTRPGATIMAQEHVLERMTNEKALEGNLPLDEYFTPTKDFYFNGEPVILIHEPKAHTDGDSIVLFRRSDVLAVGEIFNPELYPAIDLAHGGSIQGLIAAVNHILHLTVPEHLQEGGTRVIPAHGRLCNEADVVEYREMLTIIRDRIQDMLKRSMTLAQVKAAKPSLDYDPQYGNPDAFVEAVYKSLGAK